MDDTLVFSADNGEILSNLKEMVCCFEVISGLNNLAKRLVDGLNVKKRRCCILRPSSWGCEVGSRPLAYLGMPLGEKDNQLAFQEPEEKVARKLARWKAHLLFRGGRLTLATSLLSQVSSLHPLNL